METTNPPHLGIIQSEQGTNGMKLFSGNTNVRKRLGTIDLLMKVPCFVMFAFSNAADLN
jgi:hypothetical protein